MDAALIYLMISAVSFPFLGIYNSCAALFGSIGKANITFIVSIIGNVINVIGNRICIFGLHMGVAGVVLPSLLSRMIMGMILYILMIRNSQIKKSMQFCMFFFYAGKNRKY